MLPSRTRPEIVNIHAMERIKPKLEQALYTLSCDNWTIRFLHAAGDAESKLEVEEKDGVVLLFSGGLDSLCGAAYYAEMNMPVVLVSHINMNRVTSGAQATLFEAIRAHYADVEIKRFEYRVNARKYQDLEFPEEREDSQRTRSFLFLSLAALTARRSGFNKIISIAENGQFAIHLPLSPARIGPFSTHTADPRFVKQVEGIFQVVLGMDGLTIENPFLYLTKAEILTSFPTALKKIIPDSVSCWKASRIDASHCGECIPCFTRRIALEHHGIMIKEYETDVFKRNVEKLPNDNEGKRNIGDFLSFIVSFREGYLSDKSSLLYHYPELINEHFDFDQACEMYFRMTTQAIAVFDNYPNIKKILA